MATIQITTGSINEQSAEALKKERQDPDDSFGDSVRIREWDRVNKRKQTDGASEGQREREDLCNSEIKDSSKQMS